MDRTCYSKCLQSQLEVRLAAYGTLAAMALTGGIAMPAKAAIVYSGVVNITIPSTTEGIYLNVVTGAAGPRGAAPGWDFNPYKNNAGLAFFAPTNGGTLAASSTTGSAALRLYGGETIGPSGTYNGNQAVGTNFFNGGEACVGIRFMNEATGIINYGWVLLNTASGNGFPARIVSYAYENTGAPITAGPLTPPPFGVTHAFSRKSHGGATFDIDLPLAGAPAVECRNTAGNHVFIFNFNRALASGTAAVTGGNGTIAGVPTISGYSMTVELTGVVDLQQITVTLRNVTSNSGAVLADIPVTVNMLIGDVNGNRTVNATDIGQVKSQSGTAATASTFRADINSSGIVTASDIGEVKANSGHTLP